MSEAVCPYGDPCCPCPDGLLCHYEGEGAWPPPAYGMSDLERAIAARQQEFLARSCQHPRDDLYRHHLTMPNGMFPVVCTRCWGQSMSPDPTIPLWTVEMYWRHIDTIEGPERAARIRKLAGRA